MNERNKKGESAERNFIFESDHYYGMIRHAGGRVSATIEHYAEPL